MDRQDDLRLIEAGFPCHQVGAETQREGGSSNVMPPVYYLHVWWARRPLTPSRAAIVASLDSAETDPETFVCQLGIERVKVNINGQPWIIFDKLLDRLVLQDDKEMLPVDDVVLRALKAEQKKRDENLVLIDKLIRDIPELAADPLLQRWKGDSHPLPMPWPKKGEMLAADRFMGDPAWAKTE